MDHSSCNETGANMGSALIAVLQLVRIIVFTEARWILDFVQHGLSTQN